MPDGKSPASEQGFFMITEKEVAFRYNLLPGTLSQP